VVRCEQYSSLLSGKRSIVTLNAGNDLSGIDIIAVISNIITITNILIVYFYY